MARIFLAIGWLAGTAGVALAAVAGAARIGGLHWLGSFQAGTLMLGGMALMLLGCLGFLAGQAWGRGADIR